MKNDNIDKNNNLLKTLGAKNEKTNLVRKLTDYYELMNNYKELNAEDLVRGAKLILEDRRVHNYRHVAIKFLETAIKKQSTEAKFLLAELYANRHGSQEDNEKAFLEDCKDRMLYLTLIPAALCLLVGAFVVIKRRLR